MESEDLYINDLKYGIVYCNILPNQINFFVTKFNDFQDEIPSCIDGKAVIIVKVF